MVSYPFSYFGTAVIYFDVEFERVQSTSLLSAAKHTSYSQVLRTIFTKEKNII